MINNLVNIIFLKVAPGFQPTSTCFSKSYLVLLLTLLFCAVSNASISDGSTLDPPTITERVKAEDDGILKILAIGNSFSQDAIEQYLHELGAESGTPMVIGNLYIGGASLDLHWDNAQKDSAAYDYRKIGLDGKKVNTPRTAISTALNDENWDYISFQQVSGQSGQFESFQVTLPRLVNYVKQNNNNQETTYILHQTWAYSTASEHPNFPNYQSNQELMYESVVDAVRRAKNMANLARVIPAGTAIQNARNTSLEKDFTRDGYHLSLELGRYIAACTWFEALTGNNVVGYNFAPEGLSEIEVEIAQRAAHAAVQNPDEVTVLKQYKPAKSIPHEIGVN